MQQHSVRPSKEKRGRQRLPIANLALRATEDIKAIGPANCHILISCSKSKSGHRDLARNMYVSPLYRKSVLVADAWGIPFSILSAKYGLLDPDQAIEPYELTLKGASKQFRCEWATNVDRQVRGSAFAKKRLVILAGDDYYVPLVEAGAQDPLDFLVPMQGVSFGSRLTFLDQCIRIRKRRAAIEHSYEIFAQLANFAGLHNLRDLLAEDIPKQGVYFFFDDSERTEFSNAVPRLVRVGTHGVSAGSTATLRNRLRTHLGTKLGAGNHRASVFRLHIGRAIIERDRIQVQYPHWGKGQSAPKEVTDKETPLEHQVSEYIGKLRVLFIPVMDSAGTNSMRATIERQFISMFTENLCPIEEISPSWLGRFSDKATIRDSGLWNVRDVGGEYDPKFTPFLDGLLRKSTLQKSVRKN
ncbi:MAG TPA: hypothetical protein VIJ04_00425 [Xanthobacteraceae bacterium]